MSSPFLDDPRDALRRHIAAAVSSPLDDARIMHLNQAEYLAEVARTNDLGFSTGCASASVEQKLPWRTQMMSHLRRLRHYLHGVD